MHIWQSNWYPRHLRALGAALCTGLLVVSPPAEAAPQSPFTFSAVGVWDGAGNDIIPEVRASSTVGPVLVETNALPTATGKFRSAFGSNGFEIQVVGGLNREVDGGSIWSDGFVVVGGAGDGTLDLSVRISGSVAGQAEMFYGLFVSSAPFDAQVMLDTVNASHAGFWAVQFPNASRLFFTGVANRCGMSNASRMCGHVPYENYQGALDVTLRGSIPFTYGKAVYVAAGFGGGVGVFGGSQNFFNSASFGITAPSGSTLESTSGQPYAAAVPEPSAWLLMVAGMALCGTVGRRRAKPGR